MQIVILFFLGLSPMVVKSIMAEDIDAGANHNYNDLDWRNVVDNLDEDLDEEDKEIIEDVADARKMLRLSLPRLCWNENYQICRKSCGWWWNRKCRRICYYHKKNVCS